MKIKLSSNVDLKLPDALKHLNTSLGASFYFPKTDLKDENTFTNKLLKRLEYFFPRSAQDDQISVALAKAAEYINSHMASDFSSAINLHLRIASPIHRAFEKIANTIKLSSNEESIYEENYVVPQDKKIVIGVESFKVHNKENPDNFRNILNRNVLDDERARITFFHELGHMLQKEKKDEVSEKEDLFIKYFLMKSESLESHNLREFNSSFEKLPQHKNLKMIKKSTLKLFNVLASEIYADVATILLERNYRIAHKQYDTQSCKELVTTLADARIKSFDNLRNTIHKMDIPNVDLGYISAINAEHLTSFGLKKLDNILEQLDNPVTNTITNTMPNANQSPKVLTGKEINDICNEQMQQGVLKYIYLLSQSHKDLEREINTILAAEYISENNKITIDYNISDVELKVLKKDFFSTLDKEWKSNFNSLYGSINKANNPSIAVTVGCYIDYPHSITQSEEVIKTKDCAVTSFANDTFSINAKIEDIRKKHISHRLSDKNKL